MFYRELNYPRFFFWVGYIFRCQFTSGMCLLVAE
jgi:hypothetical protein